MGVDLWVRYDERDDLMVGVNFAELKCMDIKLWNVDPEVYRSFLIEIDPMTLEHSFRRRSAQDKRVIRDTKLESN